MKVKTITIRLTERNWKALKIECINRNLSVQSFVMKLISEELMKLISENLNPEPKGK